MINSVGLFFCFSVKKILLNGNKALLADGLKISCSVKILVTN